MYRVYLLHYCSAVRLSAIAAVSRIDYYYYTTHSTARHALHLDHHL